MTRPDDPGLLQRLLGPAAPEVSCDECFELLDTYVEAELRACAPPAAMAAMTAHLQGCPACAEEHESLRELSRLELS